MTGLSNIVYCGWTVGRNTNICYGKTDLMEILGNICANILYASVLH